MQLKRYSLYIGGSNGETSNGYERMRHGQTYSIKLQNNTAKRCDVEISIDGRLVGTWRLLAHQNAELKYPEDSHKQFTFLAINSEEAGAAQLHAVSRNALGVVKAQFFPEKATKPLVVNNDYPYSKGINEDNYRGMMMDASKGGEISKGFGAGGTGLSGLSGHTSQQYGLAGPIDRDEDQSVTIEVRLVLDNKETDITPLHKHNDRVCTAPPPV